MSIFTRGMRLGRKNGVSLFRSLRFIACLCGIVLLMNLDSMAQTTTAEILGTVTDQTGAVLPGAEVTATNIETGVKRTTPSNAAGGFLLPGLPPGSYEVTVAMAGFESLVRKGITLTVGQRVNLALAMTVGAVTQQMTVTGEAPIVETTESSVSGLVEEKRITDLPLNGRDFSQLALLEPGILSMRNTATNASKGFGTRLSIAGSRSDATGWLLDGMNIKTSQSFGTPGSASGLLLGVDAVREFQVLTANYSAEFGGNSGGVVNMVTKSGTNDLHGTAYEFLRNSDLDARNFFDKAKPQFKRNQFGFSVGGRIRKDKTFFFGNLEFLRAPLGVTNVGFVPDDNVHRGLVPNSAGVLQQFPVAPEIAAYLNIWPHANGPEVLSKGVPSGLATLYSAGSQPISEDYFMTRVDHHLTDNQSIFSRFTFDNGQQSIPDTIPIDNNLIQTRARYATVQLASIWTPKLLSTTRVGYSRSFINSTVAMNIDYPANLYFFLTNQIPPQLSIPGGTAFGPKSSVPQSIAQNIYELQEAFSYVTRNHSFKFGVDYQHQGLNNRKLSGFSPQYTWASIPDFLQDNPLTGLSVNVPGSNPATSLRQQLFGFYLNDDWKMSSTLTWNVGLRYEPETLPTEKYNRISTVKDWVTATHFDVGVAPLTNATMKNVAPRIGFAWDPRGGGKTVVRAGFGLFYRPFQVNDLSSVFAGNNPPFAEAIGNPISGVTLATLPAILIALAPSLISSQFTKGTAAVLEQYNQKTAYEMKFNLAVEQQLGQSTSVTVGYIGGRGVHLPMQDDINLIPPKLVNGRLMVVPGTLPPNPFLASGSIVYTEAQSFYNALQIQVKRRLSHSFQFQTAYTWSKAVDDSTVGGGATDYSGQGIQSQSYNTKSDRGLSALDQSQNLVVNGLWSLPSPAGPRIASAILGGWQVSGIFVVNSGTPFSATMSGTNVQDNGRQAGNSKLRLPDWIGTGSFASIINTGNPNQYFNPAAFVDPPPNVYGNLGRDTFIGPGIITFDMSLQKTMALRFREGSRLEFHADFFNLFNRADFAIPSATAVVNGNTGAPLGTAGSITSTVATSRQLQFGLKLIF